MLFAFAIRPVRKIMLLPRNKSRPSLGCAAAMATSMPIAATISVM